MTAQEICHTMNGERFKTYREVHTRVLRCFNEHLFELPPHYYYDQFLLWMEKQGWIEKTDPGWKIAC